MSGSISVSPLGRMPSLALTCALGAALFCAVADGDEHAAAAPKAAARTMSSVGLFMIGSASWAQRADVSAPRFCHRDAGRGVNVFLQIAVMAASEQAGAGSGPIPLISVAAASLRPLRSPRFLLLRYPGQRDPNNRCRCRFFAAFAFSAVSSCWLP